MSGLKVRTRLNGTISPRSVRSPKSAKAFADIDTRAPFESVKAAVSLFKDAGSPKSKPLVKKSSSEERVLEKETQHNMITRELDYYKDRLKMAKTDKTRAQKDLERANRTLQQLTSKLEILKESKKSSIKATEVTKVRAKELEEQKNIRAQLGNDAWKIEVNSEKERCKIAEQELIACQQEIKTLRKDFDALLEMKFDAFQKAEGFEHVIELNRERKHQVSEEVANLRNTLNQVKLAQLQAEEAHTKYIAEKETLLQTYKSAKEEVKKQIDRLKDEHDPADSLEEKLKETTKSINILRVQLDSTRSSDLQSLQTLISPLEISRKKLEKIRRETFSIQCSVDQLTLKLNEMKTNHSESERTALEAESVAEQMQMDLEQTKTELESANSMSEMIEAIRKLLLEAEKNINEAEENRKKTEILTKETQKSRISAEIAKEKLQIVLKQAGEAKMAEKKADEQVHDSPRTNSRGDLRKIRLSVEEFESMKSKIEGYKSEADVKVESLLAELGSVKSGENEVLEKVDAILKEKVGVELEIEDALNKAEMAEKARKMVEGELQKWRKNQQKKDGETFLSKLRASTKRKKHGLLAVM